MSTGLGVPGPDGSLRQRAQWAFATADALIDDWAPLPSLVPTLV